MTRRVVVVSAGAGTPSSTRLLADQIAGAVTSQIGARGEGAVIDVIEVRELAPGLAATVATGGLPSAEVAAAQAKVANADALVAVTPVFAASYSGLFKLFFDVLDTEALVGMPVLIAATAGTPRHSLVLDFAMRPLFTYLRAVVVPTGVFAATEDFGGRHGAELADRISRAAAELANLVASRTSHVAGFGPDTGARPTALTPPTAVTPFEQLLQGHTGD